MSLDSVFSALLNLLVLHRSQDSHGGMLLIHFFVPNFNDLVIIAEKSAGQPWK